VFTSLVTDGWTDGRTNGRTGRKRDASGQSRLAKHKNAIIAILCNFHPSNWVPGRRIKTVRTAIIAVLTVLIRRPGTQLDG